MKWIKRMLGCVGIALVSTLLFGGSVSFVGEMWWNDEPSLALFLLIFVITMVFLIACLLLYCVNVSLWDSVYEAYKTKGSSILRLLPNIKVVVELIDYMGCVNNNKSEEQ